MLRFVRTAGGAIGVILAIVLAATSGSFLGPSVAGRLLLGAWIAAWAVLGYGMLPRVTVEAAAAAVRRVRTLSSGDFVAAATAMVVVEGAAQLLQRELEVTVTRVLQTVAGRMVFAQVRP
jgi:hypothetical protein